MPCRGTCDFSSAGTPDKKARPILKTLEKRPSFCYRCAQDLCPEEATLGALNHLLVHRLGRMVHDNGARLVVDLGIHARVTNQVHDPLLTFILAEAETGGKIPTFELVLVLESVCGCLLLDVYPLVNLAVRLGNQMSGSIDECIGRRNQEEISPKDLLGLAQLLLGFLKIEIDV